MSNLEEREEYTDTTSTEPIFTKNYIKDSGLIKDRLLYSFYPGGEALFSPLVVEPEKFLEMYNLSIEEYVERHSFREKAQSKGGDSPVIKYMSWSHAVRLFRLNFPGLEVCCVLNPETQGYVFREIDERGYFIKAYIHNGTQRSEYVYFAILSTTGSTVYPDDKDRNGNYVANSQLFNKSYYRALVKAIAFTTGIGLKLWTGDDLSEQVLDAKFTLISKVKELADKYQLKFGIPYVLPILDYSTSENEIKRLGKELTGLVKLDKLPTREPVTKEISVVPESMVIEPANGSVTIVSDENDDEVVEKYS